MLILAVNALAVNGLAVNGALSHYIMSKVSYVYAALLYMVSKSGALSL